MGGGSQPWLGRFGSIRRMTRCGECGRELGDEYDQPMRKPCPECGSSRRTFEDSATVTVKIDVSAQEEIERGLNDLRLAVLGILVGIALAVMFGVPGSWWVRGGAGVASFAFGCFLLWWRPSRHYLMEFMHRVTGG